MSVAVEVTSLLSDSSSPVTTKQPFRMIMSDCFRFRDTKTSQALILVLLSSYLLTV